MEEILITGGAGFVGSNLTERYLKDGYRVTVLDSFKTGKLQNIRNLEKSENLITIHQNIATMSDTQLDGLVKRSSLVYHLASTVGVELVDNEPKETSTDNLKGTLKLVSILEKYNKPLIFTSTSEVYGSRETGKFCEDDSLVIGSPKKLRWSYACSKLMQEFIIRSHKIDSIILRLFNVVGNRQTGDYGMVLPRFIKNAKENKPLTIYGNGDQIRCFCHIKDCVEAVIRLSKTKECYNEIYNIGNDEESTIKKLAERVIELSGSKSTIEYKDYASNFSENHAEIMRRVPSIDKLKAHIGYSPKYNLDSIIKDLL
mgnify:CR=1 FL=1